MTTSDATTHDPTRARLALLAALILALGFYAGTLFAPLRAVYAPLCHQLAERSLAVGDGHQSVCARCAGLYLGGLCALAVAFGAIARRCWSPRPRWLAIALAPTAIDAVAALAGLPSLPNVPRLVLAMPAGFAAGLFLAVGIADLAGRLQEAPMHAAHGGESR